jgi:hypothetical protein
MIGFRTESNQKIVNDICSTNTITEYHLYETGIQEEIFSISFNAITLSALTVNKLEVQLIVPIQIFISVLSCTVFESYQL